MIKWIGLILIVANATSFVCGQDEDNIVSSDSKKSEDKVDEEDSKIESRYRFESGPENIPFLRQQFNLQQQNFNQFEPYSPGRQFQQFQRGFQIGPQIVGQIGPQLMQFPQGVQQFRPPQSQIRPFQGQISPQSQFRQFPQQFRPPQAQFRPQGQFQQNLIRPQGREIPQMRPAPTQQPRPQQPATTLPPNVANCNMNCGTMVTGEYNPVCGTDGQNYNNRGFLECARRCGTNVQFERTGRCQPLLNPTRNSPPEN